MLKPVITLLCVGSFLLLKVRDGTLQPLEAGGIALISCIVGYFLFKQANTPTVTSLFYYPVKSCKGLPLTTTILDHHGIILDRRWMVVDSGNKLLSAREAPKLQSVTPTFQSGDLVLRGQGHGEVRAPIVPPRGRSEPIRVTVHESEFTAQTYTDAYIHEWLSSYLGIPCRLVVTATPDKHDRKMWKPQDDAPPMGAHDERVTVGLHDAFPLLICNEASARDLQRHCPERFSMMHFRPNIVVRGCPAWDEDSWKVIKIGDVIINVEKPCSRCIMTTVDPETATKSTSGEPLLTLRRVRATTKGRVGRLKEDRVYFGVYGMQRKPQGKISTDMQVEVLERWGVIQNK